MYKSASFEHPTLAYLFTQSQHRQLLVQFQRLVPHTFQHFKVISLFEMQKICHGIHNFIFTKVQSVTAPTTERFFASHGDFSQDVIIR